MAPGRYRSRYRTNGAWFDLACATRRRPHCSPLCNLQNNNVKKELDIDESARTFA
jgi:hypothetical protein